VAQDTQKRASAALPHSPATERSVLASGLIDSRYWSLAESLDTDVESLFYEPDHRRIASAMHRLHKAGRVVTEDAVIDSIRAAGDEIEGGTRDFLVEMSMRATARGQAEFKDQVSALGEQRALRRISTDASQISEQARAGDTPASTLAESMLRIAEHGRSSSEPIKRFGEYIGQMDEIVSYSVPTNLGELNRMIGGWEAGRLYAIAARPKVGKTTLALNAAVQALADDAVVLMFSLEMPRRELYGRLLACTAFVPQADIQQFLKHEKTLDDFPQDQREALESAIADISAAPLYVLEASEVRAGIHDVMAAVVDVKSRHEERPIIVFIDYLQLLVNDAMNSLSEITNITRELKLMASRLDLPVVLLSQVSRSGAETESGMPNPHQMRGSGSIEQDADVTILLNRKHLQDEEHPATEMDVWVALSRYSQTGWIKAHYAPEQQTVCDPLSTTGGGSSRESDGEESRASSRPAATTSDSGAEPDPFGDDDVDWDDAANSFGLTTQEA